MPKYTLSHVHTRKMGNAPVGNGGGSGGKFSCPDGHVFTQFDVRAGQDVAAINAKCSDGSASGWIGGPASATTTDKSVYDIDGITGYGGSGSVVVNRIDFRPGYGDVWAKFGGTGGNEVARTICGSGVALNVMDYNINEQSLTQLRFWCGPFTQKEAIAKAKAAAEAAAAAAKLAEEAAARAAADAVAKALEEERAKAAAEKAAADKLAAEKAAADTANQVATAQALANLTATLNKLLADQAAAQKAAADAKIIASASADSAKTAGAAATEASKQAIAAAGASTADAAGVAARAAEQSAQNATSAAAEAVRPVVTDTNSPLAVVARDGKVETKPVEQSNMWLLLLIFVIIIAIVFSTGSAETPAQQNVAK